MNIEMNEREGEREREREREIDSERRGNIEGFVKRVRYSR